MLRGYKYLWRLDCNTDFAGAGGNGLKSTRSGQDEKKRRRRLSVSFSMIKLGPCAQFSCNFAKGPSPKERAKQIREGKRKGKKGSRDR